MRLLRFLPALLFLFASTVPLPAQDDDKAKLPRDAQAALDSFAKTRARLEDDYRHKVAVEREKLIGILDKACKEAAKKEDADAIVAIKSEMKRIAAEASRDDDTDMLGQKQGVAAEMVGKWLVTFTNHNTRIYEITADGKMIFGANTSKIELDPSGKSCLSRLDYESTLSVFRMEKGKLAVDNYNPASSYPKGSPDVTGSGERVK